jgi:hypothetical protein
MDGYASFLWVQELAAHEILVCGIGVEHGGAAAVTHVLRAGLALMSWS